MDITEIARACESTERSVLYTLKQIIMALETAMRKGYNIKLFLRIGWLKLVDGTVHFDNNASAKDLDL